MRVFVPRMLPLIVFAGIVLLMSTPVHAHSVNNRFGEFYGGMLHPITAMVHLFPIIALSLLAGQQGAKRARWVVLLFPLGLLCGAAIASFAGPNEYVTWINKISFVVLGILVAAQVRLPLSGLAAIALFFGATHGYENTADVPQTVAMQMFLPGLLMSGLALVAIVAAIAVSLDHPWQKIAVRVAGSWIAAIGLLTIGLP